MKIGDNDVLTRPELDGMLEKARELIREAGLPESAAERLQFLGFHCKEHGPDPAVTYYRDGVVVVQCRECLQPIVIVAVAESVQLIAELGDETSWN